MDKNQFFRERKWDVRVIRRGQEEDVAEIVRLMNFPGEEILARAMWTGHAHAVVEEHNANLSMILFPQDPV